MEKEIRTYKCLSIEDVEGCCEKIGFLCDNNYNEITLAELNLKELEKIAEKKFLEDNIK